jgi:CarboxypepD_reg-like domain
MGETNNHIAFSATDIEKYWKGELPAGSMHAMEKAALDDPFLADALEGYKLTLLDKKESVSSDLEMLRKRLHERIGKDGVIALPRNRGSWWKIAASVLLLVGGGVLAFQFFNASNREKTIAVVPPANKEPDATTHANISDSSKIKKSGFLNTDSLHASDTSVSGNGKQQAATEMTNAVADQINVRDKHTEPQSDVLVKKEVSTPASPIAIDTRKEAGFKGDSIKSEPEKSATASANSADEKKSHKNEDADDKSKDREMNGKVAGIAQSNLFNGRVIDHNNQPVAGAIVRFPLQRQATSTDSNGFFNFTAPDTSIPASITSVGFETQNLSLRNNNLSGTYQNNQAGNRAQLANEVQLKPQNASLNEVVVTGYGSQKRKVDNLSKTKGVDVDVLEASPVIKADEYDRYLEKNRVLIDEVKNIHGTVVVSFTVSKKGLSDFKIEQALNDYLNAEAIRLVKEGPGWKILKGKKAHATVMVKF